MSEWSMLTLVGQDRPGIVAQVTRALYLAGCTLGEASMIRLGGSFTILLMVKGPEPGAGLEDALGPVARALNLRVHLDPVQGGLHRHLIPNFQVRVTGADRPGIVADVTEVLAAQGFNILELESDVAGDERYPIYIMNIQGHCAQALETLRQALAPLGRGAIAVEVSPVEILIG